MKESTLWLGLAYYYYQNLRYHHNPYPTAPICAAIWKTPAGYDSTDYALVHRMYRFMRAEGGRRRQSPDQLWWPHSRKGYEARMVFCFKRYKYLSRRGR